MPRQLRAARPVVATAALLLALVAGDPAGVAAAALSGSRRPPAIGDYRDAIRETVYIQSSDDDNHDGRPDLLATDIIRPRGTAAGLRVPVVYEASPYYGSLGRGVESQDKIEAGGVAAPQSFPLEYDNLLVPLGYAVVLQDSRGTGDSEGCPDVLGPEEARDGVATVRWLTGHGKAFRGDGTPVTADWSTGHVGMVGKSYDGSLALETAASGVPGLDTVIDISGVSSYYDYTAVGGLAKRNRLGTPEAYVPAPTGPGDVARRGYARAALARRTVCRTSAARLVAAATATGGTYGAFDDARQPLSHVDRIRASVWIVHGLYDDNVAVSHSIDLWAALQRAHVRARLWLHQAGHADPFDVRRAQWLRDLPRWLDATLRGAAPDTGPAVQVEQTPGRWVTAPTWPVPGSTPTALGLRALTGVATVRFTDDPDVGRSAEVLASPLHPAPSRVLLRSAPLAAPLHLSGAVSLTLTVTLTGGTAPLSAYLVEVAPDGRIAATDARDDEDGIGLRAHRSCVGQGYGKDTGCFRDAFEEPLRGGLRLVTEGHLDAAHHESVRRVTPLVPGVATPVTVELQPVDVVLPAGHQLELVLAGTDADRFETSGVSAGPIVVAVGASTLTLPVVGGAGALAASLA